MIPSNRTASLAKDLFYNMEKHRNFYAKNRLKEFMTEKYTLLSNMDSYFIKINGYSNTRLLKHTNENIRKKYLEIPKMKEDMDKSFLLFIVGMGKYGKSTLVNALASSRVAEIDDLPKTWKIDIYDASQSKDQVKIIFKDKSVETYSIKEAQEFLQNEEDKRYDSEDLIEDELDKRSKGKSIEELEELKDALSKDLLYQSPVTEVVWPVEENKLLKNFRIVDTPGLTQNLLGETKVRVKEYLFKAHGVVWILDANKIAANKPKELLDEVESSFRQVGGVGKTMIAVLNRIDMVRKKGGEEAVKAVIEDAYKIFGDKFDKIIPISAKEALDGIEGKSEELLNSSNFDELLSEIESRFHKKAQTAQITSLKRGILTLMDDIKLELDEYKDRISKDEEKRSTIKEKFNKEIDKQNKNVAGKISSIINEYKSKVSRNIERYAERLFDFESNSSRESYIKNTIFEVNHFETQISRLQREVGFSLNDMREYYLKESSINEYKYIKQSDLPVAVIGSISSGELSITSDSFETDGMSFLSGAGISIVGAMLLGPAGLILGGIADKFGLTKFIAKKLKLPGLKNDLRYALNDITQKIDKKITSESKDNIDSIAKDVNKLREDSYAYLHGSSDHTQGIIKIIKDTGEMLCDEGIDVKSKDIILGGYKNGTKH